MDHYEYYSLLKVITRFLKTRDRSSYEVRSFFISKGYSESKVQEFILELQDNYVINDEKFIQNYILTGIANYWGPILIREKLLELGLDKERIVFFLEQIEELVWEENLRVLFEKKIPNKKKRNEPKEIFSCVRMIISKGYPSTIIRRTLSQLGVSGDLLEEMESL